MARPAGLEPATSWFYLGPFVAVAGLALMVLDFGVLAVAMQVVTTFLKHAGM